MRTRSYTMAVALAAGLVVLSGSAVAAHAGPVPPLPVAPGPPTTGPVAPGPPTTGLTPAATAPDVPPLGSIVPPLSTGRIVARYGFDGSRNAVVPDQSGDGHNLTIITSHGGRVKSIKHGAGRALYFPAPCPGTGKAIKDCAHVALWSPSSADLNPGTADIAYGASVELTAGRTSKGQNIVQKGYSATSSQYKLQVDGKRGHPSCVVVDDKKPGIQFAYSSVTVADGRWHVIECRREGGLLSVLVDGKLRGVKAIPPTLSITNNEPLAVGGKGAFRDNDQFQGALDDVWVRIG
jgi:hypothetical protein